MILIILYRQISPSQRFVWLSPLKLCCFLYWLDLNYHRSKKPRPSAIISTNNSKTRNQIQFAIASAWLYHFCFVRQFSSSYEDQIARALVSHQHTANWNWKDKKKKIKTGESQAQKTHLNHSRSPKFVYFKLFWGSRAHNTRSTTK